MSYTPTLPWPSATAKQKLNNFEQPANPELFSTIEDANWLRDQLLTAKFSDGKPVVEFDAPLIQDDPTFAYADYGDDGRRQYVLTWPARAEDHLPVKFWQTVGQMVVSLLKNPNGQWYRGTSYGDPDGTSKTATIERR